MSTMTCKRWVPETSYRRSIDGLKPTLEGTAVHASRPRGRGLNFEELRAYLSGGDIRNIDWKVTARTQEPHVRVYTEEKDRPVPLLIDQRMSMFFGSQNL